MAFGTHRHACLISMAAVCVLASCDRNRDPRDEDEPPPTPLQATTEGGPSENRALSLAERTRQIPAPDRKDRDGIEAESWAVVEDGNSGATETVLFKERDKNSGRRLALELKRGDKGFTSFKCEGVWSLKTKDKAASTIVIYNDTGGAMRFSVGFSFSKDFVWYESPAYELKAGWNTVRIDQTASFYKTRSSQWRYTAGLWMANDCRSVSLVFHSGSRTGYMFVEYFGLGETGKR